MGKLLISLFIVAFGQPAFVWWLGLVAAIGGYALFWQGMLALPSLKQRFWVATAWFTAVQAIQLSWFLSHPYGYIYGVHAGFSMLWGLQFGLVSLLIGRASPLVIASLWTLAEWLRLYFLSGYTLNPVGLALAGDPLPMQMASLVGVYGLSFWVIWTNALALKSFSRAALAAGIPYLFGILHLVLHTPPGNNPTLSAVVVQTAALPEESMDVHSLQDLSDVATKQWKQILLLLKDHRGKAIDLIALPEGVAPLPIDYAFYPYETTAGAFQDVFGSEVQGQLPPLQSPYAMKFSTLQGDRWMVTNAFWAQGIANIFSTSLVAGLEDTDGTHNYNSALHFQPHQIEWDRYAKRVLIPMGEYIPFSWCTTLTAKYGVVDSFRAGKEAKVFHCGSVPCGISVCYEETMGSLMRENRLIGAQMLVNVTNDAWYPHSNLPYQHFTHSCLRTVEMGVPLIRSCSTGVTGAVDSRGYPVSVVGDGSFDSQGLAEALFVKVPTYNYRTLYSLCGDWLILGISATICLASLFLGIRKKSK